MSGIAEDHRQQIQEQLDRIVASATFSGSERHRRFLSFVVEQALKGDTDKLNEFVLGFEVFNKSESFDPRIDSIVRVEARRLRERLKKYYDEEGGSDPIVITLRPRSFVPEFKDSSPSKAPPAPGGAWLHLHRTATIVLAGILIGAAITTTILYFRWKRPAPPQTASILILPFQTTSTTAGQEVLGDAMVDTIITGLAGSPGLRVISRGSGIQSKESGRSLQQIAADLQLDYIVEGTVQANGAQVRVSAKMTDVHSQSYVWAATREAKLDAVPDLAREFTSAISSRIRIPLPADGGAQVVRRRPANFQAYGAFLKGQYYWYQQERDSDEKSVALFEEATRGDPNYAPAWAWLAQSYQLMFMRGDGRDASIIAKGRQAAKKALALDDQLAEAHAAVGSYAALDWDWPTAEREFRLAIKLNPTWAQGHLTYALLYLVPTGQMRAAVGELLRAHELDPLTKITRSMLAEVLYFDREYARSIAEAEDMRKPGSGPSFDDRRYFLALSLSGQGKRALAEMKQTTPDQDAPPPAQALFGYLLATNGDPKQARLIRDRLVKQSATRRVSPIDIALVSIGLGDSDEVFRQFRIAVSNHIPSICQSVVDPVFDPVRSDPRYAEILRGIGLKSGNL